jgi:hypothetical protein
MGQFMCVIAKYPSFQALSHNDNEDNHLFLNEIKLKK